MFNKIKTSKIFILAVIVSTLSVLAFNGSKNANANIEICKHNAYGDYVCVWTENETHMTLGTRVMHNGKPAPFQPVVMRLYSQGSAIYTCDTVTGPLNAVCEFGSSAERTYSITANVAGATFLWFNGSWQ